MTEDTQVLTGEIGKYIFTARKHGEEWFVGGMTNWDERDVSSDPSFLEEGKEYTMTLFCDGINANKNGEDYAVENLQVRKGTPLTIHMAQGGGFALNIR